MQEVRVD